MTYRLPVGRRRQRAGIAVEAALLIPLLLILTFGIIEFGRMMQVSHLLTVAARTGGRTASLPGATTAEVIATVAAQLSGHLPEGYVTETDPPNVDSVEEGQPVRVRVRIPWSAVELIGFFPFTDGMMLEAANEYRREAGSNNP